MMNGGYGQSAIMGMLKRSREAAGKDDTKANISSGNKAFDDKLNNNFAAMTKMLMEQKKKKFQKLNPVSEEDSNSTASISPKSTTPLTLKLPIAPSPQMAMQSVDIVNPYAKGEKNSTSSTTMPPARLSPQIRSSKTDARHFRQQDESYGSIDQVKENMNPLSRQSPLSNVVSPMLGPVSSQYAVSVVNPYIKGQPPTIPSAPEHFAPQTTAPIASTNSVQKPDHKQLDRCNHGDPLNHHLSMMSRQHSVPTVSSKLKGPVEVAIAAQLPASSSTKLCVATETPGSKMYCGPRQTSLPVIRNKSPSFKGPWTCGVCTFHNEKKKRSRANCEMCGSSKGAEGLRGSVPMN